MEIEKILKYVEERGSDQCEVFEYGDKEISTSISIDGRTSVLSTKSRGIGIRTIVRGIEGFSYTSNIDQENIEKTVEKAIKIALKGGRKLKSLPVPEKIGHLSESYYEEVDLISEEEIFEINREILNEASEYKGIGRIVSCNNNTRSIEWKIVNSLGLNYEVDETHNTISFSTRAIVNNRIESYRDSLYDRKLIDMDEAVSEIIETIKYTEKCVTERKTSIETGEYPAIISPRLLVSILGRLVYSPITAKFHPRIIKPNDTIGSKKLTIIEDPLNPKIPSSAPIDHEGTPTKQKKIIENGTVKKLLYDQYYAEIEDVKSTGNGFRTPMRIWPKLMKPYQAVPTPQIGSVTIKPGKTDLEDLTNQVEDGIYMDTVVGGGADPVAGTFAATATVAFKIEKGNITKPIKHATITGNIKELLNIVDLTKQQKLIGNTIAPTVLIPEIRIAGEK